MAAVFVLRVARDAMLLHEGHGIVSLVVLFAALQFATTTTYLVFVHRSITPLRMEFSLRLARRLIGEIKAFSGSSLLGAVAARPEVLILSLLKNDAQIGFYSAALRIVDVWQAIPETYMRNVFPVLSHSYHVENGRELRAMLDKSIKYLMALSLPLATGMFAAAAPIVVTLYGSGFEESVGAVRIMAWYVPLVFLQEIFWRVLAARNQQHLLLRAQVISLTARLSIGYILITWLASRGAAINVSVILAAHCALLIFYVQSDGTRLGILRLSWRLSIAAAITGVLAAVLLLQSELWLVVPASALAYGVMVVTLRAVSVEELGALRKIW